MVARSSCVTGERLHESMPDNADSERHGHKIGPVRGVGMSEYASHVIS